jgi:hypothetical protein
MEKWKLRFWIVMVLLVVLTPLIISKSLLEYIVLGFALAVSFEGAVFEKSIK